MNSVAELILKSSDRLQRENAVDVGLASIVAAAESASSAIDATSIIEQMLLDRVEAIEKATVELAGLSSAVGHLRGVLRFMPEGWPTERERLAALVSTDPSGAVTAWLEYFFTAASGYRLDALHRLVEECHLPSGYEPLQQRASGCVIGLEQRNWHIASPLLRYGASGMRVVDEEVPSSWAQDRLRLLLARLALSSGLLKEVALVVGDERENPVTTAAGLALRANAARLMGDEELAQSLLDNARALDPEDLDVASELIRQARAEGQLDAAMDAALSAVESLDSLIDVDHDLGQMLEPTPELWFAVAERARNESAMETFAHALDEAERLAAWDDHDLRAVIAESRAEEAASTDRARLLMDAGERRLSQGDIVTARLDFEKALEGVTPAEDENLWASLVFRQADCVSVLTSRQPLALVMADLLAALSDLTAAQSVLGASVRQPWSFEVEYELRSRLAGSLRADRRDHLWRAFLAAARAAALQPVAFRPWTSLSDAAFALAFQRASQVLARYAVVSAGAEPLVEVAALTNLGRYGEALELLDQATDPWSQCVRSFIWLRQDDPYEAARLLGAVTIDPSWDWAREAFVQSLVLSGQLAEACRQAESFVSAATSRSDSFDGVLKQAFYHQIQGRFEFAEELAEQAHAAEIDEDEGSAGWALGQALLLRQDRSRGLALLVAATPRRSLGALDDWVRVERPGLERIAAAYAVDIGDLSVLDPVIEHRKKELLSVQGPVVELERASGSTADGGTVQLARALGRVLLRLAIQDLDGAATELRKLESGVTDEATSIAEHLAGLRQTESQQRAASRVVELSAEGDFKTAAGILARLIDETPYTVGELLKAESGAAERPLEPVAQTLRLVSADPAYKDRVNSVLQRLGLIVNEVKEEGTDVPAANASVLRLGLPDSWFEGYTDPGQEHPIFLRYLPELRSRAVRTIPPVVVFPDEGLEPDRYRILGETNEMLREGRIDPTSRRCDGATLAVLPEHVRAAAHLDHEESHYLIDTSVFSEDDHLACLLTMDASEVAIQELGQVARAMPKVELG